MVLRCTSLAWSDVSSCYGNGNWRDDVLFMCLTLESAVILLIFLPLIDIQHRNQSRFIAKVYIILVLSILIIP